MTKRCGRTGLNFTLAMMAIVAAPSGPATSQSEMIAPVLPGAIVLAPAARLGGPQPANPQGPSAVAGLSDAEIENVVAQLKALYDARRPDVVLFGEEHCRFEAAQFLAAPGTIELHGGFAAGYVEQPRELQRYHDLIMKAARRSNATNEEKHQTRMVENQIVRFQSKSLANNCADDLGRLRATAELRTAKGMAVKNQAFVDSDYNAKASAALEREFARTRDPQIRNRFVLQRLDEREIATEIRAAARQGPVWALRGYRHLLQKIAQTPTTLRENMPDVRVLTICFDYSGHDVADALADVVRDGYVPNPPDYVIRLAPGEARVEPYRGAPPPG